ncbi:hypothetical protein BaRGS_00017532, partial [Batillaria attramentaria]
MPPDLLTFCELGHTYAVEEVIRKDYRNTDRGLRKRGACGLEFAAPCVLCNIFESFSLPPSVVSCGAVVCLERPPALKLWVGNCRENRRRSRD